VARKADALHAGIWQVQAFIKGNAVSGVLQDALENAGTPNLLVQTDLTQVPTVTIEPDPLPPAVLYEGSFAVTFNQTITLGNDANSTVNFTVTAHALLAILLR
jgi:hypothetical protein